MSSLKKGLLLNYIYTEILEDIQQLSYNVDVLTFYNYYDYDDYD